MVQLGIMGGYLKFLSDDVNNCEVFTPIRFVQDIADRRGLRVEDFRVKEIVFFFMFVLERRMMQLAKVLVPNSKYDGPDGTRTHVLRLRRPVPYPSSATGPQIFSF